MSTGASQPPDTAFNLAFYYSEHGPLGKLTPALTLMLNVLGVIAAVALIKCTNAFTSWLFSSKEKHDLHLLPSPPSAGILGHVKYIMRPD